MSTRLPASNAREVARALEKLGFRFRRQNGSHATYKHADGRRTTIPMHRGDIARPILHEIIKQSGVTEDDFRRAL